MFVLIQFLYLLQLTQCQDNPVYSYVTKNASNQLAYTNSKSCPFLYSFEPENSQVQNVKVWRQFCKYAQKILTQESTLLEAKIQSQAAFELSENDIYASHLCTIAKITYSDEGSFNCCCEAQQIDTELSTQGLTAVIVVPIIFVLGGLIMSKLNSHNSHESWVHEFEQIQIKA